MTERTVFQAVADVMADVTHVGKSDRNDFHKFMFRGIDTVIDNVGPALRKHRVMVFPELLQLDSRDTQTDKGKTAREVTVRVKYTFYGPAGDDLSVVVPGEAQDTGDKAVSKAMSVAFRTALLQALAIPTREQEPDAQTYERAADPVLGLKKKIMEAAKGRGWDVDGLAQDYAEWSQGGDVRTAEEPDLAAYLKYLEPPRTMRRKPVNGAPVSS